MRRWRPIGELLNMMQGNRTLPGRFLFCDETADPEILATGDAGGLVRTS